MPMPMNGLSSSLDMYYLRHRIILYIKASSFIDNINIIWYMIIWWMYYKGRDGISKQKDSTLNSYTVLINDYRHLSSKYFFPNIFTP